ncbi:MAG: multicopper oxidase domain-containing protein [Hyphomicrobium sp.]
MVMNAFDTNFDNENEFYAVNTIPHAYNNHSIRIEKSRPVRIYLVNVTEFDPINSFHLHANFFDYYDTGTTLTPTLRTVDLITQCQAPARHPRVQLRRPRARPVHVPRPPVRVHRACWMGMFDVVEA